jgi:hypothetical protein
VSYSIPSGVLIIENVDGVGNKASGDTTTFHVWTLLKAFWNIYQGFVCFTDETFVWQKTEFPVLGLYSAIVGLSGVLGCQVTD